jgi:hypothetical protein
MTEFKRKDDKRARRLSDDDEEIEMCVKRRVCGVITNDIDKVLKTPTEEKVKRLWFRTYKNFFTFQQDKQIDLHSTYPNLVIFFQQKPRGSKMTSYLNTIPPTIVKHSSLSPSFSCLLLLPLIIVLFIVDNTATIPKELSLL